MKIGLELEYESYLSCPFILENFPSFFDFDESFFRVIMDGSLREDSCEIITRRPGESSRKTIEKVKEDIGRLFEYQTPPRAKRASTHVHINLPRRECTASKLILTLFLLEPLLYKLSPPSRERNVYCVPTWRQTSRRLYRALASFLNKKNSNDFLIDNLPFSSFNGKYTGINFTRASDLNTVELRMQGCLISVEEIVSWISVVESIYTYSQGLTPHQLEAMYSSSYNKSSLLNLYYLIFGENLDIEFSSMDYYLLLEKTNKLVKNIRLIRGNL